MPDDTDSPKPWDRQPGESPKWFARLEAFRLLGPARSLLAAYRSERERSGVTKKPHSVPEAWNKAAAAWEWRSRCEAFDWSQQQAAREAADEEFATEIRRHQQNALAVARAEIGILVDGLKALSARVAKLRADDIEASAIPSFLKALAAAGEAALNAEACALGCVEILKALDADAPLPPESAPPPRPIEFIEVVHPKPAAEAVYPYAAAEELETLERNLDALVEREERAKREEASRAP
jgi:hypothetical protein